MKQAIPSIQENGVTPLSLGTNWTVQHLWESVALSVLGPDGWDGLWAGNGDFTSDAILEYTNDDASSLSWQHATDRVINGEAAFNVMGDWAAGYFRNDTLVGSLVHGAVANDGFMNDFSTVIELFLNNRNPQQAVNAAEAIARQNAVLE